MKALSILQPWASLAIQGYKKIETRSRNTNQRGAVLIHASKREVILQDGMYGLIDHMQRIGFWKDYLQLPYGAIIGIAEIEDSMLIGNDTAGWARGFGLGDDWSLTDQERAFGNYTPGRYAWLLGNIKQFNEPVPAKGKLGFWTPDNETMKLVNQQIELL